MTKSIREWQKAVYENAAAHGFWDGVERGDPKVIPEKLCLVHSEVSECLEEYRDGRDVTADAYEYRGAGEMVITDKAKMYTDNTKTLGKPVSFSSELADIVIRTLDLAEHLGIDLERAIEEKHAFNITRPFRHGKKL